MSTDNGVVNQRALYDLSYEDCIYGCFYSTETDYDFNICADECGSGGRSLRSDAADGSSLTNEDKEESTDEMMIFSTNALMGALNDKTRDLRRFGKG
eukprot:scaffold77847_cov29-Cyclotella_meneghiniana.AAC.1